MLSFKNFIALATVSVAVSAAPWSSNENQQYQQGGVLGGQQRDQGLYRGQGQIGGNQGGFGGQGWNGGSQDGFGRHEFGGQGGQGLPMPPFLQNVSEQAMREFTAIVTNSSITISELDNQLSSWAERNNVSEQYDAFNDNVTSKFEEMKQNVTNVLTNLSSVLNSLESILENEDQTLAEQNQAVEELQRENPAEVATLFFIAQQVAKPPGGQRGHHGSSGMSSTGRPNFSRFSTTIASG